MSLPTSETGSSIRLLDQYLVSRSESTVPGINSLRELRRLCGRNAVAAIAASVVGEIPDGSWSGRNFFCTHRRSLHPTA